MTNKPSSQSVLFVCYLNSIRSPMAEGIMRKLYPNIKAQSCGMATGELDDIMVAVMREKSVEMQGHIAQSLGDVDVEAFDLVIAFTEAASSAAEAAFDGTDTVILSWPLPDPAHGSLDVRAMMNNYRSLRDNIEARLKRYFG